MDHVYSLSLLVSLVGSGLAAVLAVIEHFPGLRAMLPGPAHNPRTLARGIVWLVVLALAALMLSFFVHLIWGHGPGTAEPLPLFEFLRGHRAFMVAGVLVLTAAILHSLRPKPA